MKVLFLILSVCVFGAVKAQSQESATYMLNTDLPESRPTNHPVLLQDRTLGAIVWSDNFDTPGNWTAAGPSTNFTINGWSIGTTVNGWYFSGTGDMGTSGNFARFVNGDPTASPSTVINNGPFTLQYNLPIDLTGVPAPQLEFEQYGARFITLQGVQVSTNGGTTWSEVINNDDIAPLTSGSGSVYPKPMTRTANIAPYITGNPANVMIRLFWDGALNGPQLNYIEYGWFVDNVRIVEGADYDAETVSSYFRSGVGGFYPEGLEYYMVPQSQLTPITFSAEVFNNGAQTHTGVSLESNVYKGGNVFNNVSSPIDIPSFSSDSLGASATFTPSSGTGVYNITWNFAGTNAEQITSNDTLYDSFIVTQDIYSRSNQTLVSTIGNVASNVGGPLMIGNVMEIFNDGFIYNMQIRVSNDASNIGQLLYGTIFVYDAGFGEFVYLDQTFDHVILPGENGSYINVALSSPQSVNAGDILLVCAGHYGGSPEVRFGMAQPTIESTVLGYTSSATLFSLNNPKAIMINLDMSQDYFIQQSGATCAGDSVLVGSTYYGVAGVYTDSLTSITGSDSIIQTTIIVDTPYEGTQNVSICAGQSLTVGTSTYVTSGSYSDTLVMVNGTCDSIVHTNLTVNPSPNATTTLNGYTISAVTSGANYQWVDCNNGFQPINGETGQDFVATNNGSYAVIVTENGCSVTSACSQIQGIGFEENVLDKVSIFPNPSNSDFVVLLDETNWEKCTIEIVNCIGDIIVPATKATSAKVMFSESQFSAGIYFVQISNGEYQRTLKLIKR